jgi:hypothetical protein
MDWNTAPEYDKKCAIFIQLLDLSLIKQENKRKMTERREDVFLLDGGAV